MEVVLLERVGSLGDMGDVVNVKPGYARNYLIPQSKALRATRENIARFEAERAEREKRNKEARRGAENESVKLDGTEVVLVRQASESLQLYGSVKSRDISEALVAKGFEVKRQQVVLDNPIKTLGLHEVTIQLHPEVTVTVTANVARSEDEAETQAELGRALGSAAQEEAIAEGEAPPEIEELVEEDVAEQIAEEVAEAIEEIEEAGEAGEESSDAEESSEGGEGGERRPD